MGAELGVIRGGERGSEELAAHSRGALDRPLERAGELWVAIARDRAEVLGAFQRGAGAAPDAHLVRRGSGGPAVLAGPGTVHVALALSRPGAMVACDETRIVNRSVRPLLRALTKVLAAAGAPAHFFGADWVAAGGRPVAWVGFGHDATSARTLFEAFVAVREPFAGAGRAALRGKAPATIDELAGRPVDPARVADAIVEGYLSAYGAREAPLPAPAGAPPDGDPRADPPWAASCDEAIGPVCAGRDARGVIRVGGDLLVSRDAIARLEARLAAGDDAGRAVDATLGAPGVAIDGVRSLASVRDAIERAMRA